MRGRRWSIPAACLGTLLCLGMLLCPASPVAAAPLHSFQLTHNEWQDSQPAVGGGLLAWHHWDGNDWEIMLLDLTSGTTTQLTSNGFGSQDQWPAVDPSGRYVVYTSHQGSDTSAMAMKLYDTRTKATRTVGVADFRWERGDPYKRLPQVSGDWVVWGGYEGEQSHLYLYSIVSGQTQDLGPGYEFALGESYVVWSRAGAEIWFYDLAERALRTHGIQGYTSLSPLSISGNTLLMRGGRADGSSRLVLTGLAIGDQLFEEIVPAGERFSGVLYGDNVAWVDGAGLWLAELPHLEPTLLDGSVDLGEPVMNDRGIAYSASALPYSRVFYYDFESGTSTCVSDGVSTAQNQDPRLWQEAVIWQGKDATDAELFMANATGFADVPAIHPYAAAITDLSSRTVILGFGDGTFRPNTPVTRQQFAKMIVKALELTVTGSEASPFTDVAAQMGEDPFYPSKYVAVCAAQSITTGKTATTFDPANSITRQQLITMVVRAAGLADPPSAYAPSFTAAQFSLAEHYQNARKAAYAGMLVGLQGVGASYGFGAPSTRGECAQLLYSMRAYLATATPVIVKGTAYDAALAAAIRAGWPGVGDIFLPTRLPQGWRMSGPSPGFGYVPMGEPPTVCAYSMEYTNGKDAITFSAGYWPASGSSRYFHELAEGASPVGIFLEGDQWRSFVYLDSGSDLPSYRVLFVELTNGDGEGGVGYVEIDCPLDGDRAVAEAIARTVTRVR